MTPNTIVYSLEQQRHALLKHGRPAWQLFGAFFRP